jgi:hypothetical protein
MKPTGTHQMGPYMIGYFDDHTIFATDEYGRVEVIFQLNWWNDTITNKIYLSN